MTLQSRVGVDVEALRAAVRSAALPLIRPAVDATIVRGLDGHVTSRASTGGQIDIESTVAVALAAVRDVDAPAEVGVPVVITPVLPKV